MNDRYWTRRSGLKYYRLAHGFAMKYAPNGQTVLDVGGGIGFGCRYLEWFEGFERTSVELSGDSVDSFGVRVIHADFQDWRPDQHYDVVLCLQVLEHLNDPRSFAQKLFECGNVIVISVPYRWAVGRCKNHPQDPVDEAKLRSWVGRDPIESEIVDERLVNVYLPATLLNGIRSAEAMR